ncbi:hypothetical protein GIB67_000721, partial [Kingdonia uniflora]
ISPLGHCWRETMLLRRNILLLAIVLVMLEIHGCFAEGPEINRKSFPKGFVFGTASASYQYEGAVKEGGRGVTVWDTFAHTFGKIIDFSNGDVTVNQYHLYPFQN